MNQLEKIIGEVKPLQQPYMKACQEKLDNLTKPPGSLGVLEDIAVQLAGMMGTEFPQITSKTMVVMAGDHGVVAEGVSAFPQEVTPQMVLNFLNQGAAINVFCNHVNAKVVVVDVGIKGDLSTRLLFRKKSCREPIIWQLGPP